MLVSLSRDALLSDDRKVVATAFNGFVHQITESEAERIDALRKAPQCIVPADFDLVRRGILVLGPGDRQIERTADLQASIDDFPNHASLIILPTEKCNLRCVYCYETFEKGRMSEQTTRGVLAYLERTVPSVRTFDLAWFGGEPTLQPRIVLEVSHRYRALQRNSAVTGTLSMTTNGVLLSEPLIDQLNEVGLDVYQITLDGPRHIHDARRIGPKGGGTYDRVLSNINTILQRSSARVLIRINCDPNDPASIPTLATWMGEIFAGFRSYGTRVDYTVVPTWRADTHSIDGICLADLRKYQVWARLRAVALTLQASNLGQYLASTVSRPGALACYAGKPNSYVIGSDGTVYKCTVAFDRPENRVGKIDEHGDLHVDPEKEKLWTGKNALTDPVCGDCCLARACQGIFCPLVRLQTGARPCPTEKHFYPLMLSAQYNSSSSLAHG